MVSARGWGSARESASARPLATDWGRVTATAWRPRQRTPRPMAMATPTHQCRRGVRIHRSRSRRPTRSQRGWQPSARQLGDHHSIRSSRRRCGHGDRRCGWRHGGDRHRLEVPAPRSRSKLVAAVGGGAAADRGSGGGSALRPPASAPAPASAAPAAAAATTPCAPARPDDPDRRCRPRRGPSCASGARRPRPACRSPRGPSRPRAGSVSCRRQEARDRDPRTRDPRCGPPARVPGWSRGCAGGPSPRTPGGSGASPAGCRAGRSGWSRPCPTRAPPWPAGTPRASGRARRAWPGRCRRSPRRTT